MTQPEEIDSSRRGVILAAAAQVFLRFGYKRSSMGDLAKAAGLSRQGLYLHYESKDELFRAAVDWVIEQTTSAYRDALARTELTPLERLLGAFDALHGCTIGQVSELYVAELLETTTTLVGNAPMELERQFIDDITRVLNEVARTRAMPHHRVPPRDVAEVLTATSFGLKHRVQTPAAYRERMVMALHMALGDKA